MDAFSRRSVPTLTLVVLTVGIGTYVVIQSYVFAVTADTQTSQLVRTTWFVLVLLGLGLILFVTYNEGFLSRLPTRRR